MDKKYKVKCIYEINNGKFSKISKISQQRFIYRFKTLRNGAPRIRCGGDIYNITKKETKDFIVFDCDLLASNIVERYYFKRDDLKEVGLL